MILGKKERFYRITASNFGRICKLKDKKDGCITNI